MNEFRKFDLYQDFGNQTLLNYNASLNIQNIKTKGQSKINVLTIHKTWRFNVYHNAKMESFSFHVNFLSYSHRNENSIYHVQFTTKILHALEQYWQVQVLIIIILGVSHIVCKRKEKGRETVNKVSTFHQTLFSAQTNNIKCLRWGISFG